MMVNLYPIKEFRLPVVAECINPDVFHGKSLKEIERLGSGRGTSRKPLENSSKLRR
jgi:formylmethanofuran dehydrogenase subunit C